MTVTVLVPDEDGILALSDLANVHAVRYERGQRMPSNATEAEVFIAGGPRPPEDVRAMFAQLPEVRLVQLLSAGAEHWVDVVPKGVLLSSCRGAHGGSTAEWVVATLLSMYRELGAFAAAQQQHRWAPMTTDTLQAKRVLIVGAGDLGRQLRHRLEAFDAHVTMVGLTARDEVHGVDELGGLLGSHDSVVLMVPLTSRTRGMVDAEFLAAMPDDSVLVNVARGPVVDTGALLAELRAHRIRAALDVTDPEPLPSDHPLWTAPGLVLTPHVAGTTHGLLRRAYAVAAEEIARYAGGELPHNLVHGEY